MVIVLSYTFKMYFISDCIYSVDVCLEGACSLRKASVLAYCNIFARS